MEAFPSSHRRQWGRPGTLWPESFALWVSWLLLPGSFSSARECVVCRLGFLPGGGRGRMGDGGAGVGWKRWSRGMMAVLWGAAGHKGKGFGDLESAGQVLEKEGRKRLFRV